jgi:uncharacterized membrane protein YbaN (DUF454 family)
MEPKPLARSSAAERAGYPAGEPDPFCLDIEIDEEARSVRVFDPRAFRAGRRAFCRRLIKAVTQRPEVSRAEVDLLSASCRIEFGRGPATAESMAHVFVDSVREASAAFRRRDWYSWWRPTSAWSALTAYRLRDDVAWWETLEIKPGRLRLKNQRLSGSHTRLSGLADAVAGLDGVEWCRVSPWFRTMTLEFHRGSDVADRLLDRIEHDMEGWSTEQGLPKLSAADMSPDAVGTISVDTGLRRIKHLALAGGAFAMTVVGLIVPGVPTVPFLLATSYYLARSSPALNERLRRTALFGPIANEWEQYHGLSWSSKGKLVGLTVSIIVVTLAVTPLSLVALALIFIVSSLSIYGIARLPTPQQEPHTGILRSGPTVLALPSPT